VTECTNDISNDLRNKLGPSGKNFRTYSTEVDENTNIKNTAKFAVFILGCASSFTVSEELLDFIPKSRTFAWERIFGETVNLIQQIRTST
jgi:hypothetical protein